MGYPLNTFTTTHNSQVSNAEVKRKWRHAMIIPLYAFIVAIHNHNILIPSKSIRTLSHLPKQGHWIRRLTAI